MLLRSLAVVSSRSNGVYTRSCQKLVRVIRHPWLSGHARMLTTTTTLSTRPSISPYVDHQYDYADVTRSRKTCSLSNFSIRNFSSFTSSSSSSTSTSQTHHAMTSLTGKCVFITGASAGIGEACAREFAKTGANLVLTARRLDRLDNLKTELQSQYPNITIHCAQLDVRNDAGVHACVDNLPPSVRDVVVLINNAGMVIGVDRTELVHSNDVDTMIDTNIRGPLNLVRAILPSMRARQEGHIINVGSIAGIEAYAGGSVYCATKHALNAITQVLRHELMDTPIRVSEIKPGLVNTEFSTVRFSGDKERANKVYEGLTPLSGQDIAEIAVFIATRPQHVQIADLLVLATDQAAATKAHRRSAH